MALTEVIAETLRAAGGWLSFAEFMQLALYAPGLGYYSAGATKIGAAGDFVTAPTLSPLFARSCARRIDHWLDLLGERAVLEFGPGTGHFAADALPVLGASAGPRRRYELLEVSADLRERQQRLLQGNPWPVDLEWRSALPESFCGVVFANEILDALPAERFIVRADAWWRLGVGLAPRSASGRSATKGESSAFEWRIRPADGACRDDAVFVAEAAHRREWLAAAGVELPEGYCGEWQAALAPWFEALAASLGRAVVLIADYGLPRRQLLHPDRSQGSLRCHYRHHALGDPFTYPGLLDITTWVDFTRVAEVAERAGFALAGFTTQAGFLLGAGLDREWSAALAAIEAPGAAASQDEVMRDARPRQLELARGVNRLLLPGEMGEAVKFMLLTRGIPKEMFAAEPAFSRQDLRASL